MSHGQAGSLLHPGLARASTRNRSPIAAATTIAATSNCHRDPRNAETPARLQQPMRGFGAVKPMKA